MSKQIPLTRGLFAIVDDADFERVNQFKWHACKSRNTKSIFYAQRHTPRPFRKLIILHIFLMNSPKGTDVDHIDGNGLNCRRENMRLATKAQNQWNRGKNSTNTSGYKGVSFQGKWRASIKVNGNRIWLGTFPTAELAARAYDEAAKKYHDEFAFLNFP